MVPSIPDLKINQEMHLGNHDTCVQLRKLALADNVGIILRNHEKGSSRILRRVIAWSSV